MRLLMLKSLSSQPFCGLASRKEHRLPGAPRTDPYVQNCCIWLLPRMAGVEAQVGMGVEDFGTRDPLIDQRPEPLPCHPVALAPPPQRTIPAPDYLGSKAVQTIHIAGHCM